MLRLRKNNHSHSPKTLSSSAATSTAGSTTTSAFVKSALAALFLILFLPFCSLYRRTFSHSASSSSGTGTTTSIPNHEQIILSARNAHGDNLLDPLGRPNPICQSQYRTKGSSRGSPLIFERDNLMVCQTPKVGTTELRCIQNAYDERTEFSDKGPIGKGCNPKYTKAVPELQYVNDESTFNKYLFGDEVTRIMFVRHPVRRILSGFLQVSIEQGNHFWKDYKLEDMGYGPDAFHYWIMNSTFMFQYDPVCSHTSTFLSRQVWYQHYAPPQHCRCGIWDCGVEWEVYKIEEDPVSAVMERYIPGKWIPSGVPAIHEKTYDEKDYLTDEILKALNHLTRFEQEFFGYEPLIL